MTEWKTLAADVEYEGTILIFISDDVLVAAVSTASVSVRGRWSLGC